ncbi:3-hydroxyacyl-CoA dehydrogenase family protein [Nonomuraea indica]|uniref:3-hydroxyacyl-CoA dehydrogenase family protein n=1 Tax=Nonomuraea indica TaxID=1581193 RepID=A0ABW8ADW6_9ACTN|nr:3-hydroxyacyl-CoA dehydrogenase family protein [Nonomuraea indica]
MITHVGVVGAGTMGVGVSQAFAARGFRTTLVDTSDETLDRARAAIVRDRRFAGMLGSASPCAPQEVMERLSFTTKLEGLADAGFVVENVTENMEIKRDLYRALEDVLPGECVIGANTSAIPITRLGSFTRRADRVIGTHFMNPAHLKPLVEVIRALHTSERTLRTTLELLRAIGKDSAVVEDSPGFVTNRVLMLTLNEAICLLDEGVAAAEEIDRLFVRCFGHAMGPLATADLIGLDTVLYSLEVLLREFNDPKYRPSTLLRRYVDGGLLGRKSGRGFFTYDT